MKAISNLDLRGSYTKHEKCFGIQIFDQFDVFNDTSPISWKDFVQKVKDTFPDNPALCEEIFGTIKNNKFLIFDASDEEIVWALYGIMNNAPYYNKVFACISGPDGFLGVNKEKPNA